MTEQIKFVVEDDEGTEITHLIPAKYEVCSSCNGKGSHVNPAIDGHGIGQDEWDHEWDDEEKEAYRNGRYDVSCEECDGLRVILVPDFESNAWNEELKQQFVQEQESKARYASDAAYERRMGY